MWFVIFYIRISSFPFCLLLIYFRSQSASSPSATVWRCCRWTVASRVKRTFRSRWRAFVGFCPVTRVRPSTMSSRLALCQHSSTLFCCLSKFIDKRSTRNFIQFENKSGKLILSVFSWFLILNKSRFDDACICSEAIQFEAAWAITNIVSGTSEETTVVVESGGLPPLIQLLKSKDPKVAEQATWAIGNIIG